MKFKKTALVTSVLAATLVLTACNDKETKTEPAKSTTEKAQPVAKKAPELANIQESLLKQFQQAVEVKTSKIDFAKDKAGTPFVVFHYAFKNIGNEPLAAVQWFAVVKSGDKYIDVQPISLRFEQPYPAQNEPLDVMFNRKLDAYSADLQKAIQADPKKVKLDVLIVAGNAIYPNGTGVIVNTPAMVDYTLNNLLAQQEKAAKPAKVDEKNATSKAKSDAKTPKAKSDGKAEKDAKK